MSTYILFKLITYCIISYGLGLFFMTLFISEHGKRWILLYILAFLLSPICSFPILAAMLIKTIRRID
jgi:hypothetical protein